MIGHFVSNQESAYYQSKKFSNVLEFLKDHPNRGKMYEKNGVLRMSFTSVERIDQAMEILRLLDGQKVGA